jgi:hypothetical protein
MSQFIRGLLTFVIALAVTPLVLVAGNAIAGKPASPMVLLAVGAIAGSIYGLEAAILCSYDLSAPKGWLLLVDLTWSLPNTLFGLVFGNLIYLFVGIPSRDLSEGEGWVSYRSRGYYFGTQVLQTLGTVNLGGRGKHEMVHVTQARILGPFFLPVQGANYVANFLAQILFTGTIGGILALAGVREKAYLRPPSSSAVGGFWGWIYYATVMELWAYGTEP